MRSAECGVGNRVASPMHAESCLGVGKHFRFFGKYYFANGPFVWSLIAFVTITGRFVPVLVALGRFLGRVTPHSIQATSEELEKLKLPER